MPAFNQLSHFFVLGTAFCLCFFEARALSDNDTHIGQLFLKQVVCPGRVVHLDRCPVSMRSERRTPCSLRCAEDSQCLGFLREAGSETCYLCRELVPEACRLLNTQPQGSLEPFEKLQTCNQNSRLTARNRCECVEGMVGDSCQTNIRDCNDWYKQGFTTDGLYWLRPSMEHGAFQVNCGMEYQRTYFMRRDSPTFNFYRGWEEYVTGFGDVASSDHWLGLDKMSLVTNAGLTNSCLVLEFLLQDINWYQSVYKPITISDAASNFSLHFSTNTYFSAGNYLGDCLADVNGRPFSTYDADHDGDVTTNCAERHQSGWWLGRGRQGSAPCVTPRGDC